MDQAPTIIHRIERLEREGRRWKRTALVLGLLLVGSFATGMVGPRSDEVVAGRFVLRGSDGTEHAVLGVDPSGSPHLSLNKGKSTAILTMAGPGLLLRAEDGRRGAFLGIDTRGVTRLDLSSEKVIDGVRLTVQEDGSSGVYVLDETGRERVASEVLSTGNCQFSTRDAQGTIRTHFGLDGKEVPSMLLIDDRGRRRIGMVIEERDGGRPLLAIEDERGRMRAALTERFDGSSYLRFLREDGKTSFEAP